MAGNGSARSAGVAYIDLAVGDSKKLVDGIAQMVRAAADQAQQELTRGFDVSNQAGSFQAIVDAASEASSEASGLISHALSSGATASASEIGNSISSAVHSAAASAAGSLEETMSEAGREAGSQLSFNFEEATRDIQLTLFDENLLAQAAEEGRLAGEALARSMNEELARSNNQSTASLGSVFSGFHFQGIADDVQQFTTSLTGGLRFAATGVGGFFDDLQTRASSAFQMLPESFREGFRFPSDAAEEFNGKFEEFGSGLKYAVGTWAIGSAIGMAITGGVTSAFSAAKSAVIDFNSEMQSADISFGTLLGSESQANSMLAELKKFTLGTPFLFSDIVQGSQKLLALGISAKDVIPDLTGLGDAVSALGGDGNTLNSVVNVFGEMQSKGQVMEVQIRELQIRGIPALKILANEYGVSTAELQKMIRAGKVMADDALPKLIDGMERGTATTQAMGGEMARQSLTFKGSVSNLKDGLTQFTAAAFKPAFDSLNGLTSRMANFASGGQLEKFVEPISKTVSNGLKDVGEFVHKLIGYLAPAAPIIKDLIDNVVRFSIVKQIFNAIGPVLLVVAQAIGAIGHNQAAAKVIADLVEGFILLTAAQEAWNVVMAISAAIMDASIFGLLVIGIGAVVIGVVALYQHSKTFRDILADIGAVAKVVWGGLVEGFEYVKNAVTEAFGYVERIFKAAFDSGPVQSFISWLTSHFAFLRAIVVGEIQLLGKIFSWLWQEVIAPAARGIGDIAVWLWKNALEPALAGIVAAVKVAGEVFTWLWKNIIEPVVNGIWFTLRLLFVIVFTLLVTPFVIAYHLLEPVIAKYATAFEFAFKEIGKLADWLWREALKPVFDFIEGLFTGRLPKAIREFWKNDVEPAFRGIGEAATWLWKNAIDPAIQGIADLAKWLWREVFVPLGHGISDVLSDIGSAATWLWKNAIVPAWDGISSAASTVYRDVLVPVGHGISDVMSGIGTAATWLWKNVIDPAFQGISTAAKWLWREVFVPVFNGIGDAATWLWKNILDPAFTGIGNAAKWVYNNLLKPAFDGVMTGLKDVGHWASWLYDNAIKPVFNAIGTAISDTLSGIKSGFKTAVDGITSVWNGLVDTLKGPVNFLVNTVYTHGIEEVWNFIADKVGIPKLPDAPHFKEGGVIGGPASAGDWIPIYGTAGEGILTVAEMAALGGPAGFASLRAMLGGGLQEKSSDGHYKGGGVIDSIWGGVKSIGSAVSNGIGSLESFASRIVMGGLQSVAKDMLKPVLNGLGNMLPGNSVLKQLVTGIPNTLIDGVLGWFGGQDKKSTTAATAGMPGDISNWISQAESAAGVDSSWTAALAQIIKSESGGDPRAINLTDSNAQAGDPSRGLMQTIMSTFEAYRLPSLPDDIYNPVANIVAGIRYIISRYGNVSNVPGIKALASGGNYVGYAMGTMSAAPGWSWVGEEGPELIKLRGGEEIRSHRDSIKALSPQGPITAPSSGTRISPSLSAPQINFSPTITARITIGNQEVDGHIDLRIDKNNLRLAQVLNGGVSG
jgi:tape measure domain-containing protein